MTQNPYFYVMFSFVLALLVGYKKIWPSLNLAIQDDINCLKEEFYKIDKTQYTLELALKTLKNDENKHIVFLDSIQSDGKEKIEQMTLHHKNTLQKAILDRREQIKEMLIRERQKFKKIALIELSKDLEIELRKSILQEQFLNKSFNLLAHKDAA